MSDDVTMIHCFVIFYIFGQFFFTTYLCQFELLEVLRSKYENNFLLIELKYKLLHYNKVPNLRHLIALLYNNNIFHKNDFFNLEIFLKDTLKITDISILALLK